MTDRVRGLDSRFHVEIDHMGTVMEDGLPRETVWCGRLMERVPGDAAQVDKFILRATHCGDEYEVFRRLCEVARTLK